MSAQKEIQQLNEFAHGIDKSVAILIENQKSYHADLINSRIEFDNKLLEIKTEFNQKNLELDSRLRVIEDERKEKSGENYYKRKIIRLWPLWVVIAISLSVLRFHEFAQHVGQFIKF